MQQLEVSANVVQCEGFFESGAYPMLQVIFHITMLSLVLVPAPSSWMMLLALQVLASYWSAIADQYYHTTVITILMLV